MARDWEDTFRGWSKPGSETEQEQCANAERMIKVAMRESRGLSARTIEVFAQGSYRNGTNVRLDSDVDICVRCMDPFFSDFSMADGFTKGDVGLVGSNYTFADFKDAVEQALIAKFGRSGVARGNKAFDVHANPRLRQRIEWGVVGQVIEWVTMSRYKHAYALFGSARMFLESAVRQARESDPREWKFALLHSAIALELLAKACLALEDPFLIAKGKVDYLRLERGEFRSLTLEEAFQRLEERTGFLSSTQCRATIEAIKAARNRFVHFTDVAKPNETRALLAAALNLFFELHETGFSTEDEPWKARSMVALAQDLSELKDFVACRMSGLAGRLQSSDRPRTLHLSECQRCLQEADVIAGDSIVCLFCGSNLAVRDWAERLSADRSVESCPDCQRPGVAKHQARNQEPTYECFCCGYFRGPELRWLNAKGQPLPRLRGIPEENPDVQQGAGGDN